MDISSLLLIEDSADSEGDTTGFFSLCHNTIPAANNNIGHDKGDDDDDDDAESCTCDRAAICGLWKKQGNNGEDDDSDFISGCNTFWMSEEEEEGLEIIECTSSPNHDFLLVVDDDDDEDEDEVVETRMIGGKVNVNEVEDKLFWEICMAVGYP